ncbi:MAG: SulP family inorganic anion transporter [Coleofasciculus sp. B1-GNL1-01]|uniref:bicarbonate transporter BicA n=1 Tax=Coleofasciculus sp. B1-GNL1-01 TaxID=3068484 RepID=UPI0033023EF6
MRIANRIHFRNLQGDIFGGITAAIIALPMALAFGVASGAGAVAGLWGAVLVGFFAALFGGTPTLISEPTGPMTVVMTAVIANLTATAGTEKGMAMAFTVVMMAGVFQIIMGTLRLGRYVTLMPYTVVSGFMSGIGFILVILQLAPFLGQDSPSGGILGTIQDIPDLIRDIQPGETALAVLTVTILVVQPLLLQSAPPNFKKFFPPPQLIALVIGTVVALVMFPEMGGIRRIGEIPQALPNLQVPTFSAAEFQTMLINALVLAMLGCIDALLTSVVADSLTRSQHNSNKELIGQGLGNLASGLCGGIAGAGATMGTVVNIQTGARTAISGLTRALILLVVILGAASLTAWIPMAVLAGIALKVGIDIIDWGFLKRAHKVSIKGAMIMYGVIILTVFVDLIVAVGVGVFVANLLTIERLSKLQAKDVKTITDADDAIQMTDEEKELIDQTDGRILLFHLSGPMIFGVSKAISRQQNAMADHDVLIVDLSDVPHLGVTSSLAIENSIQEAIDKGRQVFIVGATGQIERRLQKLGILSMLPAHNLHVDRTEALRQAVAVVKRYELPENGTLSTAYPTQSDDVAISH